MIILAVLMFVSVASSQNFWQRTEPYFAPLNRFSFAGGDTVYGALGSGFTRSVNNGDLWTAHLIVNYVTDMAVAPNGSIFMSQNQQKISRSTNKGNSFTVLGTGINETSCSSVLTTQTGSVLVGTQKGIYRSTNNGDTWTKVAGPAELQGDTTIATFTRNASTLYAVSSSNNIYPARTVLFRSTDDGLTWSKGSASMDTVTSNKIVVLPNGTVVAKTNSGVRATTDGGNSWSTLGFYLKNIADVAVSKDGVLYCTLNDNNAKLSVYRSTDNGATWTSLTTPFYGGYAIGVNASGHLFVSSDQTYRSTDQGATWKALPVGFPNVTNFTENSKKELFVTSGGFAYQTLYRSSDFGNNWLPMNTGVVGIPNVGFYGDTILVGDNYYNAKMFRSTDNGATFKNVSGMTVISGYINALIGTSYQSIIAGTSTGIYRSVDHGKVWKQVSNVAVTSLYQQPNGTMYGFRSAFGAGMIRSVDSGSTWTEMKNGMGNTIIYSLAFAPNGDIFAGTDGALFRSTDAGGVWARIDTQKTGKPYGIYIAVNRDGKLFTGGAKNGTNSETYQSTNGGVSWSMIQNNITSMDNSANFRSLFVASNGRLFAGTTSGLFRSSSVTTDIARTSAAVAAAFELAPNYPNPFNPSTTIGFTLDVSGVTSLKIFDALGREVAVLADGYLEAGVYHQRTFHATHLSSGMYVAQLMNGQRTQFRKMLLMK
jgi:photosystem II stability/assembly factor-like uncharacterized protein